MSMHSIAVIGAGAMGKGIAEAAARAGLVTRLIKATAGAVDDARRAITASLDRAVNRGKLDVADRAAALSRISYHADLDAIGDAELVIESVVEDLHAKQELFAEIERFSSRDAVLATNTSSLRVRAVGEELDRSSRARLLGIHFFSPVPAMKLVEIAPTRDTAPFAVERAHDFARMLGKQPVLVGDSSGYIVNRLLVPYLVDAMAALEARVGIAADIDDAMRLGCGHPMGPLALADAIGLDVVYAMARTLYLEHNDPRYSPPAILRRLVQAGHLGKKTGLGIFDYRVENGDARSENPLLHPHMPFEGDDAR
jgi:3-hydroxybutyryl-CoA dehydrogenase